MRIAEFITADMENILAHWEAFAATQLPAAASMSSRTLRDHAEGILRAVAKDLRTAQSREAQTEKGLGRAPKVLDAVETAAQTHGFLRANSGFDINQMTSEFRALRASVLRRWMDAQPLDALAMDDLVRFNEAIDQALAESVTFFSARVEETRNLFLGMLGHDMRTPLQAILLTASYLGRLNAGDEVSEAASRLIRSGGRMQALLSDLVEFNRTSLGLGMPIKPGHVDVEVLFRHELEELRAAHPKSNVELEVNGDTKGWWDASCLQRVLGNLVVNAIKYGAGDSPIQVKVNGAPDELCFSVWNTGDPIEQSELNQIFEPFKRGGRAAYAQEGDRGLGLGLYIARQVAVAHGGEIEARCHDRTVIFEVRLPRRRPPA